LVTFSSSIIVCPLATVLVSFISISAFKILSV
jgi:hypothetical protein